MWYEHNDINLDYSKPIFAKSGENIEILLPQMKKGSYEIIGYDWFSLTTGEYHSCVFFLGISEALSARNGWEISNKKIILE